MILRTVMISHYRCRAGYIAEKSCNKNPVYIHKHAVCRNAVFPRKAHKLKIIEHCDNIARNVGNKFRRTVGAGLPKSIPDKGAFSKPKKAGIVFS